MTAGFRGRGDRGSRDRRWTADRRLLVHGGRTAADGGQLDADPRARRQERGFCGKTAGARRPDRSGRVRSSRVPVRSGGRFATGSAIRRRAARPSDRRRAANRRRPVRGRAADSTQAWRQDHRIDQGRRVATAAAAAGSRQAADSTRAAGFCGKATGSTAGPRGSAAGPPDQRRKFSGKTAGSAAGSRIDGRIADPPQGRRISDRIAGSAARLPDQRQNRGFVTRPPDRWQDQRRAIPIGSGELRIAANPADRPRPPREHPDRHRRAAPSKINGGRRPAVSSLAAGTDKAGAVVHRSGQDDRAVQVAGTVRVQAANLRNRLCHSVCADQRHQRVTLRTLDVCARAPDLLDQTGRGLAE